MQVCCPCAGSAHTQNYTVHLSVMLQEARREARKKQETGGHRTCVLSAPPVCPWPLVYPIPPSLHLPLSLHPSVLPALPAGACGQDAAHRFIPPDTQPSGVGCCGGVLRRRDKERLRQMERHRGSRSPKLGQQLPQSLHFCPALDPGLQGEHI